MDLSIIFGKYGEDILHFAASRSVNAYSPKAQPTFTLVGAGGVRARGRAQVGMQWNPSTMNPDDGGNVGQTFERRMLKCEVHPKMDSRRSRKKEVPERRRPTHPRLKVRPALSAPSA